MYLLSDTTAEGLDALQARINQMRDSQDSSSASAGPGSSSSSSSPLSSIDSPADLAAAAAAAAGIGGASDDDMQGAAGYETTGSFSDADDAEVSAALGRRISQIATTTGEWGSSMDEEEMRQPLTGQVRGEGVTGVRRRYCQVLSVAVSIRYHLVQLVRHQ